VNKIKQIKLKLHKWVLNKLYARYGKPLTLRHVLKAKNIDTRDTGVANASIMFGDRDLVDVKEEKAERQGLISEIEWFGIVTEDANGNKRKI